MSNLMCSIQSITKEMSLHQLTIGHKTVSPRLPCQVDSNFGDVVSQQSKPRQFRIVYLGIQSLESRKSKDIVLWARDRFGCKRCIRVN